MSALSSEVVIENQSFKLQIEFFTQINKELEQLKLIGLKEDDSIEMMRQIGSYKGSV